MYYDYSKYQCHQDNRIFGTHFQLCAHLCIAHCYSNKQKHKLVAYSYFKFHRETSYERVCIREANKLLDLKPN